MWVGCVVGFYWGVEGHFSLSMLFRFVGFGSGLAVVGLVDVGSWVQSCI